MRDKQTNEQLWRVFFEFSHFFFSQNIQKFAYIFSSSVEKPTERERERNDDADVNDFNDDSDDDENDRRGGASSSSKSSFLLFYAQSKRGGFLLLLLEIVLENKDDYFLVQKFRRGRAKALQKNVYNLVVILFEKKKECCKRLFLFV